MKRFLLTFEDSGMAIAPLTKQLNKKHTQKKHMQCVQGTTKYMKKLSCGSPNKGGYQVLQLAQK